MNSVDIVKIDKLITIYKDGAEANSIQVARVKDLNGNSCQFNIVVGKGIYEIGDSAIYIMPDYCIPPTEMFNEYYAPGGDEKKSKLGKKGRIRAIKFNFLFENEIDPIYSNGILISFKYFDESFIQNILKVKELEENQTFSETDEFKSLQELFGVIKYVAEESVAGGNSGLEKGDLPSFLYSTDETRIEVLKDRVDNCFEFGEVLSITLKRDGSSITEYVKIDEQLNDYTSGICSRNKEKKLDQSYTESYKDGEYILHRYNKKSDDGTIEKGWINDFTKEFYTENEIETKGFEKNIIEVRDSFVDTIKENDYLNKLIEYCKKYNVQLALRGELIGGGGSKGSGNKLNSDIKLPRQIIWFGVDDLSFGHAKRINYSSEHNLHKVCGELNMNATEIIFEGVLSYDEIIKKGNEIFNDIKTKTGNIIEGIVIRTKYSNKLSTKYLNPEYDSKK